MPFRPDIDQQLVIDNIAYYIAEHPAAPGIPYGQEGRQGIVYALTQQPVGLGAPGLRTAALKVFKTHYRYPALAGLSTQLAPYAHLPGLKVCQRTVLVPQHHNQLLAQYPDLTYAMLMPWIEGPTWMDVLVDRQDLTSAQSLTLARNLAQILAGLEQRGLAHADLSAPNLILPGLPFMSGSGRMKQADGVDSLIELVDVEQLCAPGLTPPQIMASSSPGYGHRAAQQGSWGPESDRFAGAVLLAEMLGWCRAEVRSAANSESYFDRAEMQQESDRYRVLMGALQIEWGDSAANLFSRAWHSLTLQECPTFGEWCVALPPGPSDQPGVLPDQDLGGLLIQARQLKEEGRNADAYALYTQILGQIPVESPLRSEVEAIMAGLVPAGPDIDTGTEETVHLPPRDERLDSGTEQPTYLVTGQEIEMQAAPPSSPRRKTPAWAWVLGAFVLLVVLFGIAAIVIGSSLYVQKQNAAALEQSTGTAQAQAAALTLEAATATAGRESTLMAEAAEAASLSATQVYAASENTAAAVQSQSTQNAQHSATSVAETAVIAAHEDQTPTSQAQATSTSRLSPKATAGKAVDTPLPAPTPAPVPSPITPTPPPQPATPASELGGKLAFSLRQGTSHKVYVVEVAADPPEQVYASVANARQPALSHDGKWLLVNGTGGGMDAIARLSSDGHGIEPITCPATTGESGRPVWSPEDTLMAFDGLGADPANPPIYIQPADQIDCELENYRLQIEGGYVTDSNGLYPLWGPDDRIYFRSCATWDVQGGSICGVWSVQPDGGGVFRLVDDPNFLPTDVGRNQLLLMGAQRGNWDIFSVSLDGGEAQNLTNQPSTEVWGTLSPDGLTMAYLSNQGGRWAIWLADADGSNPREWLPIETDWGEIDPDQIAQERMSWSK